MSRKFKFSAIALVLAAAVAGGYSFISSAEAETAAKTAADVTPAAGTPAAKPSGKTLKDAVKPDAVYATFGDDKITGKDVLAFMQKMPPALQSAPDQLLAPIVNQMVNDKLVAKAAADEKLENDPKTQQMILEAKEQVIRDRYVEKALDGKVTDDKIKAKYDELVTKASPLEEVHARHILVSDEKTANEVLAKLNKGGDFAALAKQYSIDPSKANGGDLGYVTKDLMVKEFGDALFAMKKGEVSKTPVKTQFGYHIIKVEDRRTKPKPKFDDVKEAIRKQLMDEEVRNLVQELRKKTDVKLTLPTA